MPSFLLMRRVAVVVAAIFCCAAVFVAGADSHLSGDPRANDARALYQKGEFRAALDILRPLAKQKTGEDQTDILFLTGISAIGAGRQSQTKDGKAAFFDEAIAAFRAILAARPELVRVRLELARAFFLKGDDTLAKEHFERVLAGDIPPVMAANIRRFLSAIRARRKWSANFDFALAPNSNLNAADNTDTVVINGLPFRLSNDAQKESGVGVFVSAGGEYRYPLANRWRIVTGANINRAEYRGHNFDGANIGAFTGAQYLLSPSADIAVYADWRRFFDGENHYSLDEPGFRLAAARRIGKRLHLRTNAAWRKQMHRDNAAADGFNSDFSIGARWLFSPTIAGELIGGASRNRPRRLVSRNRGRRAGAGLTFILPRGWTLGANAQRQWSRPEGQEALVIGGGERRARATILQVSVLHRAFAVFGFSPRLSFVREKNQTNYQIGNYHRNRAELRFVRQF